ncbi:TolC family protein [Amphritea sp.]|uniref:TolC family protein n=1 Tax=Amphritea sp. TaxID=1872502 RepID=UPI0025BDB37E|nr:TolC family protein [Amphritea sp.]
MNRKVFIGFSLLLVAGSSSAMSVDETVSSSLSYHPAMSAATNDQRVSELQIDEAKSGYRPTASIEISSGVQWANNTTIRGFQDGGNDTHVNKADFRLRQMLFDGGSTRSRLDAANSGYEAAGYLVNERQQDIITSAVQSHLNVLRSEELLALATDNLEAHRKYLEDIESRASQGVITETDAHHARARYAFADASLMQQEEGHLVAISRYLEIVGIKPEGLDPVSRPTVAYNSLEEALDSTLNHPTVMQSGAVVQQARANYEQSKTAFAPTVDFEIRSTIQDSSATSDLSIYNPQSYDTFAGVVASYDLSNGGADVARKGVTAARQASAEELYKLAARDTREAIRTSWYSRDKTADRVPLLQSYTDSLELVLADYIDQFSVNRRDLLDLLDRQSETFRAKADLVDARYDLLIQDFELLQATGQLSGRFSN